MRLKWKSKKQDNISESNSQYRMVKIKAQNIIW